MGKRDVIIRKQAAEKISSISLFIASKGLPKTAIEYSDKLYDYLENLGLELRTYPTCKDLLRRQLGYKCINYKRKFTIVISESDSQIVVIDIIPSKLIY